jgi:anti-anti-sigma factor
MADMRTEVATDGLLEIWRPVGRIDHLSAGEWGQRFDEGFASLPGSVRVLILDLAAIEFLSSAGLRELMKLSRRCREADITLGVCQLQETVREVFEISRFNLVIPMHATLEDALAATRREGKPAC